MSLSHYKKYLIMAFCVLGAASEGVAMSKPEKAIFAGGCFWCMESEFEQQKGVLAVVSGYTGGTLPNPTYEHHKGHVEAVEVEYDPAQVDYPTLLSIYWSNIDPTDAGGQFFDRGDSYKTTIFVKNDAERAQAEASKQKAAAKLAKPVMTEILPATTFYPAEDYHQDYYKKNPTHYNAYKKGSGREQTLKGVWGE
jgi:peptide-methionine (S)-S-oxide reductase